MAGSTVAKPVVPVPVLVPVPAVAAAAGGTPAARASPSRIARLGRPAPPNGPGCTHDEPAGRRNLAVPAPARRQPGRLVAVVGGGVRGGAPPGRPGAALRRVRRLPLVPRDGPRVV